MKTLVTIEEIHKFLNTSGSRPAFVTCNDLNKWVSKYERDPRNLFNEFIAARFAEIWKIPVPDIAFIKVQPQHVPQNLHSGIQRHYFNKLCFGSFYLESTLTVDKTTEVFFMKKSNKRRLANTNDFLKIAFFDIWLGNDDRHHNNYNLLINSGPEGAIHFYVIDHVQIFNGNHLAFPLTLLTEDETIINSDLAKVLFNNKKEIPLIVNNIVDNIYLCKEESQNKTAQLLKELPESWSIDRNETNNKLNELLFSDAWFKECINYYRTLIQQFLIN